jgi:hypothetical protein
LVPRQIKQHDCGIAGDIAELSLDDDANAIVQSRMVARNTSASVRTFVEIDQCPGVMLGISGPGTAACVLAVSESAAVCKPLMYAADAPAPAHKAKRNRTFPSDIQVRVRAEWYESVGK